MDWYIYDCVADRTNCWRTQGACEASHISLVSQAMINVKHLAECYSICLASARILPSMLVSILAPAKMNQRLLSSNLAPARINHRLLSSNLAPAKMNNLAVLRLLEPFDPSRVAIANRSYRNSIIKSLKIQCVWFIYTQRYQYDIKIF